MNAICSRRGGKSGEPISHRGNDAGFPVSLLKGEVRTLHHRDRVAGIAVKSGAVWLTETPADADIILRANEQFRFAGKWRVVIEALENSEMFFKAAE